MLNIGMTELLIFGVIALLILGPDKLPEAVRFVGNWYGKIKRTVSNIQHDFDRELRLSELREQMQNELKRIEELESKMQAQMADMQKPIQMNELKTTNMQTVQPHYTPVQQTRPLVYINPVHVQALKPQDTEFKVAV